MHSRIAKPTPLATDEATDPIGAAPWWCSSTELASGTVREPRSPQRTIICNRGAEFHFYFGQG
jgi:hypothetical protein